MSDLVNNSDEVAAQQQRVINALKVVQQEVRVYRKLAQKPPVFLKDGVPKKLRSDALTSVRLYSDRFDLMRDLVKGGAGAEVGVQHGTFSRFLLDHIQPTSLDLFDLTADLVQKDILDDARTTMHVGDSSTLLGKLPDQSLDWIYVDGDHRYAGVKKDTDVARLKIRPGGMLIFNDYVPWSVAEVMPYGVMPVVNDLINDGFPVAGLALANHGYYDIAVRYAPL